LRRSQGLLNPPVRRYLAVSLLLALTLTEVVARPTAARGAGAVGPSVPLPTTASVPVTEQLMASRPADQATLRELHGDQPTGGAAPDGSGTYAATSLSPSGTWDVSAQTGDFSWSYPLRVPPAPGGLSPSLALSYTSSAVDGRTSSTNNQSSWIGDGWDLSQGFVERTYGACASDTDGGTTPPQVGDLCWKSDNAAAVSSGGGEMLVRDAGTGRGGPSRTTGRGSSA